jgi:hypothetical protein
MRRVTGVLILVLLLSACGGSPMTAADVVKQFQDAGLDVANVRDDPIADDAPIPHSYTSHINFTVPSAGVGSDGKTRGGQVFVCETKKNCDPIYLVFDGLKVLGGPYYYQSPAGTIVVQMHGKMPAEIAAKYEAVVKTLP